MIKILIADDHKLFSETLAYMLRMNTDFEVIAICLNSDCAIETIQKENPDVVLMDINMKPLTGVETTIYLAPLSASKIIGLSMHSHPSYSKKMFRAGALGYVTKNSPTIEIFTAIREVAKGNQYVCDETKKVMEEALMNGTEKDALDQQPAEKETTVINLQKDQLFAKRKSGGNNVSLKTIKGYWNNFWKNSA